jgi:hypothetical protein
VSQPAEPGDMRVSDPRATQGPGQRVTTELRVVSRAWNCPNVDDTINAVGGEQADEFVDRPCGMPDSENRGR